MKPIPLMNNSQKIHKRKIEIELNNYENIAKLQAQIIIYSIKHVQFHKCVC